MADVTLTQEQAAYLAAVIETLSEWCPDENYEAAMDSLTNASGIEEPVDRISELLTILNPETSQAVNTATQTPS
jgi:hypothetical protein